MTYNLVLALIQVRLRSEVCFAIAITARLQMHLQTAHGISYVFLYYV